MKTWMHGGTITWFSRENRPNCEQKKTFGVKSAFACACLPSRMKRSCFRTPVRSLCADVPALLCILMDKVSPKRPAFRILAKQTNAILCSSRKATPADLPLPLHL